MSTFTEKLRARTTEEVGELWAADPHEYGPGKVHVVDVKDRQKTFCGRFRSAIPGRIADPEAKATCRSCLDAIPRRRVNEAHASVYRNRSIWEGPNWQEAWNRLEVWLTASNAPPEVWAMYNRLRKR
jgi:hypothetical protein